MGKNAVTVRAWVLPNAVRAHRLLRDRILMTSQSHSDASFLPGFGRVAGRSGL